MDSDHPTRMYLDPHNKFQGHSDTVYSSVHFHAAVDINSTAITNSFIKSLIFQGHLSEKAKDDVSIKVKNNNRIGYDFNAGLTGAFHRDHFTIIGSLNYRENFNAKFSKDLFEVLFRGNKNYAGETAHVSPATLNYYSYQNFSLGFSKQLNFSNYILGASLSFLNGLQYQRVNLYRGNIFTSEDGEYIDVDARFDVQYSKNKIPLLGSSNGYGTAINFNLARWTEKSRINIEFRDLGFIHWKNINKSSADSSFRYEGIEIQNILDYQNYNFHGLNADSLKKDYNINDDVSNDSKWVPFTINANYRYLYSDKIQFLLGGKYTNASNYIPKIYFKTLIYINNKLMFAPALYGGGYGLINLELAAVKSFGDNFIVSTSITCLEYLLVPSKTQGFAVQVGLSKVF